MENDLANPAQNSDDAFMIRGSINEAHEDINEFNATKKTISELLDYKKSLIDLGSQDFDKINEIKSRAIEAINSLFNDIIQTPKTQ